MQGSGGESIKSVVTKKGRIASKNRKQVLIMQAIWPEKLLVSEFT
jgi:hypothetical protein